MNKYALGVAFAAFGVMAISVAIGLRYSQATLLWGFVAIVSAPLVIHKIPDKNWSLATLVVLALFASFPFRKLFRIEDFVSEIAVIVVYAAALWTFGLGWRRAWR